VAGASSAEINEEVGGEDAEEGLVIHCGPEGQPHGYEVEHASTRPELVVRALNALNASPPPEAASAPSLGWMKASDA
jgi:hypothetical protein